MTNRSSTTTTCCSSVPTPTKRPSTASSVTSRRSTTPITPRAGDSPRVPPARRGAQDPDGRRDAGRLRRQVPRVLEPQVEGGVRGVARHGVRRGRRDPPQAPVAALRAAAAGDADAWPRRIRDGEAAPHRQSNSSTSTCGTCARRASLLRIDTGQLAISAHGVDQIERTHLRFDSDRLLATRGESAADGEPEGSRRRQQDARRGRQAGVDRRSMAGPFQGLQGLCRAGAE